MNGYIKLAEIDNKLVQYPILEKRRIEKTKELSCWEIDVSPTIFGLGRRFSIESMRVFIPWFFLLDPVLFCHFPVLTTTNLHLDTI